MINNSKQIKKLDLKQNAIKILINSIYGAFGNKWFYFYNLNIAQSITLQGQDVIKFSIKAINFYFRERWHLDTELHEQLNISHCKINKIEIDTAIYSDTDSLYVDLEPAINSIKGVSFTNEECLELCVKLDQYRISEYFNICFEKYAALFNTKNRLQFKLEHLSETGIWIKKKMYALKISYEPNKTHTVIPIESRYLVIKGLEPAKGSYPAWARKHLISLTEYMLKIGNSIDLENDLIPRFKKIREEYDKLSISDIAFNFRIRKYEKYVESEKDLILKKGISIYARSAAYFNHLLITSGLNKKYSTVREGDKIKFYFCDPTKNEYGFDVFAYSPRLFPSEIALDVDRDHQFFNLIIDPINRQLNAMGLNTLDVNLNRDVEIIKISTKKEILDELKYQLYVLNKSTLEYEEVKEKFWKVIGNPKVDVSPEDFPEYLNTITKYGLNTVIVPKIELEKYLKKIRTKNEKLAQKKLSVELELEEEE